MNLHFGPMKTFIRLTIFLIVFLAGAGCSRATDRAAVPLATEREDVTQSEDDMMSLKLNALNYTEIPIGRFYVDGTWGGNVPSRIGSGGGRIFCCVSLPNKWRPGLTVTVEWRNDDMFKKDPKSIAGRVVPVEKYEYFSDGFLWVLFFPGDRIKVYASQWMPGFSGFPEGLQAPNEACPGNFTILNSDPRCPIPDKRIKP